MLNVNDLSSDIDLDITQKITKKRKKGSVISTIAKHNIHSKGTSNNHETHPITCEQLAPDIQSVLPHNEEYTYVVQSHQTYTTNSFKGAPEFSFEPLDCINLDNKEAVDKWLEKMMEASLWTYRVTRGCHKPRGTRIVCRHKMHCQHYRKPPTAKQIQHGAATKAKKDKKALCTRV